jgi:hypothetical protein
MTELYQDGPRESLGRLRHQGPDPPLADQVGEGAMGAVEEVAVVVAAGTGNRPARTPPPLVKPSILSRCFSSHHYHGCMIIISPPRWALM